MDLISAIKNVSEARNNEAAKILAESVNKVSMQVSTPKNSFLEVLDIVAQVTDFSNRKNPMSSESQLSGEILIKLCSFMQERAQGNTKTEELAQELIILSARLYANITLNK